jgi:hypothetical protein
MESIAMAVHDSSWSVQLTPVYQDHDDVMELAQ